MAKVLMVQYMKHKWKIVAAEKGHVILTDINISTIFHAREFIRGWVSSFHCWDYEVIPMKDGK